MNYSELIALLPGYVGRPNDADMLAKAPTFIALFEAKLNRKLRTRRQLLRTTITPSAETEDLPDDYGGFKNLRLVDSPATQIEPVTSERMTELAASDGEGSVQFVTVEGGVLRFWPAPSSAVSMSLVYFQRLMPLTADSATNWLVEDHPDAYLYGCALEAYLYLADTESVSTYAELLSRVVDDITAYYQADKPDRLTQQGATVV